MVRSSCSLYLFSRRYTVLSQNNRVLGHRIPGVPVVVTIDPLAMQTWMELICVYVEETQLGVERNMS